MAGPLFAAWTRTISENYNVTLYFFAGLLIVALVFSLLIRLDIKRLRNLKAEKIATPEAVTPVLETVES
jgi:OFA family oxalate/formate antiporter-like MFS transporter